MCVWQTVSHPNALNVWNIGYISLIQFTETLKAKKDAAEPGHYSRQEENSVVSKGMSDNKSTCE